MSFNLQRLNEISKPDKTWKRQAKYMAVNKKKLSGVAAIIVAELKRKADEKD